MPPRSIFVSMYLHLPKVCLAFCKIARECRHERPRHCRPRRKILSGEPARLPALGGIRGNASHEGKRVARDRHPRQSNCRQGQRPVLSSRHAPARNQPSWCDLAWNPRPDPAETKPTSDRRCVFNSISSRTPMIDEGFTRPVAASPSTKRPASPDRTGHAAPACRALPPSIPPARTAT